MHTQPMTLREVDGELCCPSVLAAPLDEAEAEALAQSFAALADPVRLRLLSLVAAATEVCSCELQEPLGKSQPTVSHHTKALADAGLIVGEKRGRWVYWRVVPDRVEALRAALAP
ncbi:MAG: ArsR family transcriptional regulator, arsenate/arsenite/antimonite-responsive transcriptional [Actinomycetota bacterium]|nr:ArsR family transcriptional regulator, arsenate/arsenite/antimonite-responsive transcriptional [Actinomycetota bacterium]